MPIKKIFSATLAIVLLLPVSAFARHNDGGGNGGYDGIDRDDLDNDIVEEVPIPILFGLLYKNIRSDFGDPRDGGARTHEGQDLFAPPTTPIVSPTEAIVISVGKDDTAGNYVSTANPGGETFRYMHLDDVASLERGDELKVGDYIGSVGDTGNAKGTPHHLHFEIRSEDRQALDPYPRLIGEFTLKQKMSFLDGVFKDISNDEEYASFLVDEFETEFRLAIKAGYDLPEPLEEELEARGIVSAETALQKLTGLFISLPKALALELGEGSNGPAVTMLQMYLVYTTNGPARDTLANVGPTGYYGAVTAKAVSEYQTSNKLSVTGRYDAATRAHMMKRTDIELQIK